MQIKNFYTYVIMMLGFTFTINQQLKSQSNIKAYNFDEMASHIDSSISPGKDFFAFANNNWFKKHPIPGTESSYGIFKVIQDTINNSIKNICEKALYTKAAFGTAEQKIGDFYASGMDTNNINKVGVDAISTPLKRIETINSIPSLMKIVAYLQTVGVSPMFSFYINKDDKISSKNAVFLWQGGLGLPERDYYFNSDTRTAKIREAYKQHLQKMFVLSGGAKEGAVNYSATIWKIEESMAKVSRKLEDLRDPQSNYNKMPVAEASKMMKDVGIVEITTFMGLQNVDTLIIGQPEFFKALNVLLSKYSLDEWKQYLHWNVINTYAAYLNKEIESQNFDFYERTLSGKKEQKPRWKTIVESTDDMLGELIGQIYVAEYLPKGTKEKLFEIGNIIKEIYAERIKTLDWMTEKTKEKALYKLSKINMKFGYPDKWKDMSNLNIDRTSYAMNVMRVNQWAFNYMLAKYGKPVDRNEWSMQPQTYNAYYDPGNNEIVVPGCNIIVPGYEGKLADDAILYSIIGGSTIGHEITHGFDDQGSQYDADGNLNDWWTKEDKEKFQAKTKLIVNQFDNFVVLDSLHVNGEATQGENIADLGGIIMGYKAFIKTGQYKSGEKIAGLSPDQRFFLGYAFAWMMQPTDASLARQIMTDVHAPARFRVNGPLSNMPEFYKAFGIKDGDPMLMPDKIRVRIW